MIKFSIGRRNVIVSKIKAGIAIGILWGAVLSAAVFLVYLGLDSYSKARSRVNDQATSYAHLIAEHDRFGFTLADVILKDLSDHLTVRDFGAPLSPERRAEVLTLLRQHRERLPGIASFTLVGADGIRRIGVVGKDGTDLSDRGYFKALRDGQEFFISNVEDGRASGKPGIHVTRRFSAPDGSFAGIVELNLAAEDVFFAYYKSINLGANFGTTLRDPQRLLISYPRYTLSAGRIKGPDILGEQIASGLDRGLFKAIDPVDGLEKVTAFERLEGTNFYASASLPTADGLAESKMLAGGALFSALAIVLGAFGATSAITKAHALAKARDEAVKADSERKLLIRKLNTIVEDERRDISIEIHDVLNAMLVRVRFDADSILRMTAQAKADAVIEEIGERAKSITQHASDLYDQCRRIVRRLRPEILDVLGLDQAVDEMVRSYDTAHPSCHFTFTSEGDMSTLESNVSIAAYRLIQEALSNIVKHAKASRVAVSLKRPTTRNTLEIDVVDDGVGFDLEAKTAGVGLVGMRERVAAFNGRLDIRSSGNGSQGGTQVRVSIPLDPMVAS